MERLLIIIGNQVFSDESGNVLLPMKMETEQSLEDWLQSKYAIRVLHTEQYPQLHLHVIAGDLRHGMHTGQTISFAAAAKRIGNQEPELIAFLNSKRQLMQIQLQYGIRGGKIIHISEISPEQRGLNCQCVCPGCGMPLVARLGTQKQKHFAHHNAGCDTASAQQTALHMLAKEIIEQERQLLFPGISVTRDQTSFGSFEYQFYHLPLVLPYKKPKLVTCDAVVLEKKLSDIVPDILVQIAGRTCLVEIAVTHFVDDEKRNKVESIGLPLMEINLSSLSDAAFDREAVRTAVLWQEDNRSWIYNPKMKEAVAWAEKIYAEKAAQKEREDAEREQKRQLEQARQQRNRERSQSILENLFQPEVYRKRLTELRNDAQADFVARSCTFYSKCTDGLPFFLDLPITGEMIFPCDRRIWQSRVFDRFIYHRKEHSTVHIKRIQEWLRKYQKEIPIDWSIAAKAFLPLAGGYFKPVTLFYDVVNQYLKYLTYLGFIDNPVFGDAAVLATHTLCPPNPENADSLQAALSEVNVWSPQIDNILQSHAEMLVQETRRANERREYLAQQKQQTRLRAQQQEQGAIEVTNCDFDSEEPIRDKWGYRWLRCIVCGEIRREDDMISYGGRNSINQGICKKCRA